MKICRLLILVLCFSGSPVALACSCVPPATVTVTYTEASVVVAAEAEAISDRTVKDERGDLARQTVLWRVHENWKGKHKVGSTFTTRTFVDCCICGRSVAKGDVMLLYLYGKEPYKLSICGRSKLLKLSLKDVPLLYEFRGKSP